MNTTDSHSILGLLHIWEISCEAERQEIITAFKEEHGNDFNKLDFASFLSRKYRQRYIIQTKATEANGR
ncbi:MAG: hypothetical protein HKP41_04205 [Desulfobacterales bacterium]|nr:hypothetical protein [Deltaproteobacteria bacterium]NNK93536.1 hypothetical protein [Desulfobacterales bacterium]